MSDINCPYCDAELEIDHDDWAGYSEDELHEQQCSECEKYFTFTTSINYYYEAFQADCLNDAEHQWKPSITYPKQYSRMRCETCDHTRACTEDELNSILNS